MNCSSFETRYGSGVVYATDLGVVRIEIPDMSGLETTPTAEPPAAKASEITTHTAELLQEYFLGVQVDFGSIPVVLDALPPFRRRVLEIIRMLQYGQICSYGQVAQACGSPRASRAVGGALASNPIPIIIPCHRVVAGNGMLTGFSAPGGECTKRELLKMEGIEFKGLRVDTGMTVMHIFP